MPLASYIDGFVAKISESVAENIPTISEWGKIILILLISLMATYYLRRKQFNFSSI